MNKGLLSAVGSGKMLPGGCLPPRLEAYRGQGAERWERGSEAHVDSVTTGGVANVKTAWREFVKHTYVDTYTLVVQGWLDFNQRAGMIDIGIGGAGGEQVLIPNLFVSDTGTGVWTYRLPVRIPKGSRISWRAQTDQASIYVICEVLMFPHPLFQPARDETGGFGDAILAYSANTATTRGTTIDPGGSAGVKGAWVTVAESVRRDIRWATFAFGNRVNSNMGITNWYVDIGVGASGQEEVALPDLLLKSHSSHGVFQPYTVGPVPFQVPPGSRVSVRASSTTTDATDRLFDVIIYA